MGTPTPQPSETGSFLSPPERDLLGAICDQILPPGGSGPGASEAEVVTYIDRQLAGPWGQGARMYREGPFQAPEDDGHGWQSPLTPAEVYTLGLQAIEEHALERFGTGFCELSTLQQTEVVELWESGGIQSFDDFPGKVFFEMVRQNVIEGLLSDPSYGGNRDMVGWRWLGYPGMGLSGSV